MKKLFITIMGFLVVVACNRKPHALSSAMDDEEDAEETVVDASRPSAGDADHQPDTLQVSRLDYAYDVGKVQVTLSVDWPQHGGSKHLLNAIREYISEQMGGTFSGTLSAGNELTTYYGDSLRDALKANYAEEQQNVEEEYINGFSHSFTIRKVFETPRMVSYQMNEDIYLDGAHGMEYCYGVSFRKTDGRRFDYSMMRDIYTEAMSRQLKDGLKEYFSEVGHSVTTDEELKEFILTDDDVNSLPLPRHAPYFTANGLMFIYQPYEISFYAAGMPQFALPVSVVMPFLKNTAVQLFQP